MKLSVSAYRAHASAHKKILSSSYQLNYGSTGSASSSGVHCADTAQRVLTQLDKSGPATGEMSEGDASAVKLLPDTSDGSNLPTSSGAGSTAVTGTLSPQSATGGGSSARSTSREEDEEDSSNNASSGGCKSPSGRRYDSGNKSNQRWMKLRTTVQLTSAIQTIQKKPPLKREDSFLKRFSTRQIPETQETVEDTGSEGNTGDLQKPQRRRRRVQKSPRSVVNPDENF
ncbi:uncharacterized protein LOC113377681, partial [Ctenocephalides felis]|uniref:uncharacterized protein LOC113377681 n=1 Tax=Ctenocephalides felis TaxID=7515 RepID=UPI000E6E2EF9